MSPYLHRRTSLVDGVSTNLAMDTRLSNSTKNEGLTTSVQVRHVEVRQPRHEAKTAIRKGSRETERQVAQL